MRRVSSQRLLAFEVVDDGIDGVVEVDLLFDHPAGLVGMAGPVDGAALDHQEEAVLVIVEDVQGARRTSRSGWARFRFSGTTKGAASASPPAGLLQGRSGGLEQRRPRGRGSHRSSGILELGRVSWIRVQGSSSRRRHRRRAPRVPRTRPPS